MQDVQKEQNENQNKIINKENKINLDLCLLMSEVKKPCLSDMIANLLILILMNY